MAKFVLGIDFGEDTCTVAVATREGSVQIIQNDFKCVIAFNEKERIFGDEAKNQESSNMENTISGIRYLIGRHHNDQDLEGKRSFQTSENPDNELGVNVEFLKKKRTFSPTQIAGMIFAKLKQLVEEELKTQVTDVVIGVPSYFSDVRKEAVCNAARIAGLNVLELMNETTASALNYAHANLKSDDHPRNAVFLNVCNRALQVSVVKFDKGSLAVLATSVDPKFVNIINNQLIMDKAQIKETMEQCLKTSGIKKEDICDVFAVGISGNATIKNCLVEVFNKQPLTLNEKDAVARGCANKASSLCFKSSKFNIQEANPTFPDNYEAYNNAQYPKNLTIGNLSALMRIEEKLAQEEEDEKNRLGAKNDLEHYLDYLKGRLEDTDISHIYFEDLVKAIKIAEERLKIEGENIQREEFTNIRDEFKKHEELIENGDFQSIYSEEGQEEQAETEDYHNQSNEIPDDKAVPGKSPQASSTKTSSLVKDRTKTFEQQGQPDRSPAGNASKERPVTAKKPKGWMNTLVDHIMKN